MSVTLSWRSLILLALAANLLLAARTGSLPIAAATALLVLTSVAAGVLFYARSHKRA